MSQILAIDPGPTQSALVEWDGVTARPVGILPNAEALAYVCASNAPTVAIEMIASYGMSVGESVFETCVWIGRFQERALSRPVAGQVIRIKRLAVKEHICKSVKANDSNIRQALLDRLGPPGTKKAPGPTYGFSKDLWAALAVAVTVRDGGLG